uniref:Uncharacterized protein n=1 Tax=Glossina pallidipes TaxID=7398 RepID=A0A1A9ZDU2_GLOPL
MNEYACYDSRLAAEALAVSFGVQLDRRNFKCKLLYYEYSRKRLLDHAQEKNISQTNKQRTSTSNNILKFCRQRRACLIMSVSYSILIQYLTCPSLIKKTAENEVFRVGDLFDLLDLSLTLRAWDFHSALPVNETTNLLTQCKSIQEAHIEIQNRLFRLRHKASKNQPQ